MKNFINLHLIETDSGLFKFSVLVNDVVFTDRICHSDMQEAISSAVKLADFVRSNAFLDVKLIHDWESKD